MLLFNIPLSNWAALLLTLGHIRKGGGGFCSVFLSSLNWLELDLWDQSQWFNNPKFLSKISSLWQTYMCIQLPSCVWLFVTHGLRYARPPCPSPSPRVCPNSCPLNRWCHSYHLILCCPLLLLPSIFPRVRVFLSELAVRIRWPKYGSFSFSISPSNEYSGLISFRIAWLDLLAVPRDSQESSPAPEFKTINSLALWSNFHICTWLLERP